MAHGEVWGLGDQATVAVLMEELEKVSYEMIDQHESADDMTIFTGRITERSGFIKQRKSD
mgnify:CR=1 FL=1